MTPTAIPPRKAPADEPPALVFVESNTTGTGMIALDSAREAGLRPVLLTADPARYQGLDATGATVVRCDTNTFAELAAAVHALPGDLAGVTTTSDFYVALAAELAASLGLPGNPPDAVRACRDKARTRELLREAGLPQPRFAAVCTPEATAAAVVSVGLPCVVKPVGGSGSELVRLCGAVEQAEQAVRAILGVTTNVRGQRVEPVALVEAFLDGPEFSVEMFSRGGEACCVGVTRKSVTSGDHCVETRHIYPAPVPEADHAWLADYAGRVLGVLGITTGPTHLEVRLTSRGPELVEINPRLAGGMIPELVRLADGRDLLRGQLDAATGRSVDLSAVRRRCAGVAFLLPPGPGTVVRVTGVEDAEALPGVVRVIVGATPGRSVRSARDAYDRLGSVIACGADAAEVDAVLDKAIGLIGIELAS
ncbi:ATP-grasp domain-containing protein [Streptomyces goshikiensis]|uniref:ATP-grasp domain-containing protein n=1 Tax=Streptomyces goshikiensis TaxID=1942 RepID=UPI0036ADC7A6